MSPLILHHRTTEPMLAVPVWFLTEYMPEANGDFVKVYLYLLMVSVQEDKSYSISDLADHLGCTESDVTRALKYWDRKGLLSLTTDEKGVPTELSFLSPTRLGDSVLHVEERTKLSDTENLSAGGAAAAEKAITSAETSAADKNSTPSFEEETEVLKTPASGSTVNQIISPATEPDPNDPELNMLIKVSQAYLGRMLTSRDVDQITNWYVQSGGNFELVDYLFEYCSDLGKTGMRYMDTVFTRWLGKGITTAAEAEMEVRVSQSESGALLRAVGASGRTLTDSERERIDHWKNQGFSFELILEAVRRSVDTVGTSKYWNYANGILESWKNSGVYTMEAVARDDESHKSASESNGRRTSARSSKNSRSSKSRFNNFEGRDTDYGTWQKELLDPYRAENSGTPAEPADDESDDFAQILAPFKKK